MAKKTIKEFTLASDPLPNIGDVTEGIIWSHMGISKDKENIRNLKGAVRATMDQSAIDVGCTHGITIKDTPERFVRLYGREES